MLWNLIEVSIQVGLLYVPLVLGIYLAMGVMSLPDLTLQGSFGVGGSVAAVLSLAGVNPLLSLACAMLAGAFCGLITAALHLVLRLSVLLAGILVATACYSLCLVIMSSGNLSLAGSGTIFSWAEQTSLSYGVATILTGAAVAVVLCAIYLWFLHTEYGLSLVAAGKDMQTARGLGVRTERRQLVGLAIANSLSALSGGLVVHSQGFMDVTIQTTVIVIGLAAMMVGLSMTGSTRILFIVFALVGGAVVYRFAVSGALQLGLDPNLLQLITAALVVLVIAARSHGKSLLRSVTRQGRRERQIAQAQFYEEDRVASFI